MFRCQATQGAPSLKDFELWHRRAGQLSERRLQGAAPIPPFEQPVMRAVRLGLAIFVESRRIEDFQRGMEVDFEVLLVFAMIRNRDMTQTPIY